MIKNILISISICLLFVMCVASCVNAQIDTEYLINSAIEKINELGLYGKNIDKINKSILRIKRYDWEYNKTVQILDVLFTDYSGFYINASTGRIIELFNKTPTTIHEGEDKPKKPKEEIIKQAEKYFKIINGEIPKDAFFYDCEFLVPGWNDTKHSYDGEWFVFWGRKAGDYAYKEDWIKVIINEKYGLVGYYYKFFSEYSPPKKINISQDRAVETARNSMRSIIYSPYFEGNFHEYEVGKYDSSKLMIVNPNYSHRKGPQGMNTSPKPFARLAWVVVFECVPKTKTIELPAGYCETWIDAETEEVLGGTGGHNKPF